METRIKEMEALYNEKMSTSEFESKINEIAYKNEEVFREYYQALKNNYDKAIQKTQFGQHDFERLVEQRLEDISKISLTFDTKLDEMNKVILNANIVDDLLNKVKKMENLTFAMEDMLKESHTLKAGIVEEHSK